MKDHGSNINPNFQPELLRFSDGTPVLSREQWDARRMEILEILRREVYGNAPPSPERVDSEICLSRNVFEQGISLYQQISVSFDTDGGRFSFPFRLYHPGTKKVAPLIVLLSFGAESHVMTTPVEALVDSGFALAILDYRDVTSDTPDMSHGLAGMYDRDRYSWGKIGMWAWGVSRILDCLSERADVNFANVAVIGHSRLGKTALWCAAQDTRIRFAISNNSGSGGAAYHRAKVDGNEKIADSVRLVPYWYCERYPQWAGRENDLPFDQHFLIAAIAPRCVCIGSAKNDLWAGPYQEQLSGIGATPAWELFGMRGYVGGTEPANVGDAMFEGNVGYCLRDGIHYLGGSDWNAYTKFIQMHLQADFRMGKEIVS